MFCTHGVAPAARPALHPRLRPRQPAGGLATADILLDAEHAAEQAGACGLDALTAHDRQRSATAASAHSPTAAPLPPAGAAPADEARTLIRRFECVDDLILRSCAVPFSNNLAERDQKPVTVQQRTSGGCWRTQQGPADFAVVQSYLSTVEKWGLDKPTALEQLFTTGAWLPPALTPTVAAAAT